MHCLTVTYPAPKDASRFRSYYESTHVPLTKQLPGLKSCSFAYPSPLGPSAAPFCIFQAFFADEPAMMAALQSAIGQKVAADVANYSPDGATLFHFAVGK
jgi:uncharacterized protein (TIGR02118 family)